MPHLPPEPTLGAGVGDAATGAGARGSWSTLATVAGLVVAAGGAAFARNRVEANAESQLEQKLDRNRAAVQRLAAVDADSLVSGGAVPSKTDYKQAETMADRLWLLSPRFAGDLRGETRHAARTLDEAIFELKVLDLVTSANRNPGTPPAAALAASRAAYESEARPANKRLPGWDVISANPAMRRAARQLDRLEAPARPSVTRGRGRYSRVELATPDRHRSGAPSRAATTTTPNDDDRDRDRRSAGRAPGAAGRGAGGARRDRPGAGGGGAGAGPGPLPRRPHRGHDSPADPGHGTDGGRGRACRPRSRSRYLGRDADVELFPAWETLPFERVSPSLDTMGRRLRVIWKLRAGRAHLPAVVVAPVRALVQRLGPHVEDFDPIRIHPGVQLDRDALVTRLVAFGYRREYQVEARGEVAVRGSIVDVYPTTDDHPVRIDLWGDEVDRLSRFSVADQRSTDEVDEAWVFPARELLPTAEVRDRAAGLVGREPWGREQWERLADGQVFDGMESWLPWLSDREHLLPDLLPDDALVLLVEPKRTRDRAQELLDEEAALASTLSATWGATSGRDVPSAVACRSTGCSRTRRRGRPRSSPRPSRRTRPSSPAPASTRSSATPRG